MKITANVKELSQAAIVCSKSVLKKNASGSISGILLKAYGDCVQLTGYDLSTGITTTVRATVHEDGAVVMDTRFADIIKSLPTDTVTITVANDLAQIESGDVRYSLIGMSADDYPELPSYNNGESISVAKETLLSMVRQTIFCVSTLETKPILTGIKFEIYENEIKLTSCDGFRLSIRKEPIQYCGNRKSFVVPSTAMNSVVSILQKEMNDDVEICVFGKHVSFTAGGYTVFSRLLDGEFLNTDAVIPKSYNTTVRADLTELRASIERTALIITDKIKSPLRCSFDDNLIRISSTTALGTANDKIPAEITGAGVEIGFNNRFLFEALRVCDTDEVYLQLNGSVSPLVIVPPDGDRFLFLILPVRLQGDAK